MSHGSLDLSKKNRLDQEKVKHFNPKSCHWSRAVCHWTPLQRRCSFCRLSGHPCGKGLQKAASMPLALKEDTPQTRVFRPPNVAGNWQGKEDRHFITSEIRFPCASRVHLDQNVIHLENGSIFHLIPHPWLRTSATDLHQNRPRSWPPLWSSVRRMDQTT